MKKLLSRLLTKVASYTPLPGTAAYNVMWFLYGVRLKLYPPKLTAEQRAANQAELDI